jgi:hypothetical protein
MTGRYDNSPLVAPHLDRLSRLRSSAHCDHANEVRWNPMRGEFTCLQCNESVDIPELLERDPRIAIKL